MRHNDGKKTSKPIVVTIRYCDESELTVEERARMESARIRLNRQVRDLIGKLVMEQRSAAGR